MNMIKIFHPYTLQFILNVNRYTRSHPWFSNASTPNQFSIRHTKKSLLQNSLSQGLQVPSRPTNLPFQVLPYLKAKAVDYHKNGQLKLLIIVTMAKIKNKLMIEQARTYSR